MNLEPASPAAALAAEATGGAGTPAGEAAAMAASVLDAVDTGIVVIRADDTIGLWNRWMEAASGISAALAVGRMLQQLVPGAGSARLCRAVADASQSGVSSILTHSLNRPVLALASAAGGPMAYNIAVLPLPGRACLLQLTDVTLTSERERVLRERQNARYDAVVSSAADAIVTLDAAGIIRFANPAASEAFGYDAEELVGAHIGLIIHRQEPWDLAWQGLLAGMAPVRPIQLLARRKEGSDSFVEVTAARWQSDTRMFVTAILRDTNERHAAEMALRELNQTLEQRVAERTAELMRSEEALLHAQKMESLGQLTGGIAHDFNNLLTGIIGAMNILKRRIAAGQLGDVNRFMDAAVTSAHRAAALTHRLLAFARRQPLDLRPTDVNRLVAGMVELLQRSLGERVVLRVDASDLVWPALSDSGQLENAILNLVINARDAMPDGGEVTISTFPVALAHAQREGHDDIAAGDYTAIQVRDTGSGMTADTLARAFDPFFTTKPIGKGTGLGLSMIYGFAKQSRGHVRIDSELGKGTAVTLFLPSHAGGAGDGDAEALSRATPAAAGETVVVVEDDPAVRLLVGEVLRELGYATIEAPNAEEALDLMAAMTRIDLLITDVGLPGMNGRQLAERARLMRPDLKVLFVTGYAEQATARREFLPPGTDMVTKPFDLEALGARIRAIIETARP